VKLHAAIEMNWRAIVSFHFTRTYVHEMNHLEPLLEPLWDIGNVLADSGYLSRENCRLIVKKGGIPYIRPKKNTNGKGIFGKRHIYWDPFLDMVERYQKNPAQWMNVYHQRSNIEAVFSALKRKLGGYVSSIKRSIQHVEIALKIIVYNLMILVRKIVEEEYF
jgi:transposase